MKEAVHWVAGLMAGVMVLLVAVSCGQAPAGALTKLEGTPSHWLVLESSRRITKEAVLDVKRKNQIFLQKPLAKCGEVWYHN